MSRNSNNDVPFWQIAAVVIAILVAAAGMYYAICGGTMVKIVAGAVAMIIGMSAAVRISEIQR